MDEQLLQIFRDLDNGGVDRPPILGDDKVIVVSEHYDFCVLCSSYEHYV